MIRSMTGYGRADVAGPRVSVSVEARSVNHRHLDIAVKLPRILASLEADVRRLVQSALVRGRIELSVSLAAIEGGTLTPLTVNVSQAREHAEVARRLAEELGLSDRPTLAWLLEQPGVVSREAEPALVPEDAWPTLAEAVGHALSELQTRRRVEGQALAHELSLLRDALGAQVDTMASRAPAAVERRAARLRERVQSLLGGASLDEGRIATEVAMWAEKTDTTEELARLRAHLEQFDALVRDGGAVGRTVDFLIQEMNREVNTVGAKADDLDIAQAVIAAKGALEKLREQAQNIE
jgi:uncharacterized protein (TIGR00255 family)